MENEVIERVKDAARIEDFIMSRGIELKKSGVNYVGQCPIHKGSKKNFTVSPSKQIFKCFGCGAGGNAFTYLMKAEGLDFIAAVKMVADKYHIDVK